VKLLKSHIGFRESSKQSFNNRSRAGQFFISEKTPDEDNQGFHELIEPSSRTEYILLSVQTTTTET